MIKGEKRRNAFNSRMRDFHEVTNSILSSQCLQAVQSQTRAN